MTSSKVVDSFCDAPTTALVLLLLLSQQTVAEDFFFRRRAAPNAPTAMPMYNPNGALESDDALETALLGVGETVATLTGAADGNAAVTLDTVALVSREDSSTCAEVLPVPVPVPLLLLT